MGDQEAGSLKSQPLAETDRFNESGWPSIESNQSVLRGGSLSGGSETDGSATGSGDSTDDRADSDSESEDS